MTNLTLSTLPKTWLIDVDGTIVKHNGHLSGEDQILDGVLDFFSQIPASDKIIFLTSREQKHRDQLCSFLQKNGIRYDQIIFELPFGERVLINDKKPSGLKTAHAINLERDFGISLNIKLDGDL